MKSIDNTVNEVFNCSVSKLFNLVTAPANWLGLHPVTKGVYGPNINHSLDVGGVAIEHIVVPEKDKGFDAVWLVTEYKKDQLWTFESLYFGGEVCKVTIQYTFDVLGENKVSFKRYMRTDYTSEHVDILGANTPKTHETNVLYFDNIRKRLGLA